MNDLKSKILEVLATILTPNGKNMVSADIIRALSISHGDVSFVIEVEGSEVSAFSEIIKKAKKEPRNSFTNNQPPDLDTKIL